MFYKPTILNMILFSLIQGAVMGGLVLALGPVMGLAVMISFVVGMLVGVKISQ